MKTEPRAPYNCTPRSVAQELSLMMFAEFPILICFRLVWTWDLGLNLYWVFVSSFHIPETTPCKRQIQGTKAGNFSVRFVWRSFLTALPVHLFSSLRQEELVRCFVAHKLKGKEHLSDPECILALGASQDAEVESHNAMRLRCPRRAQLIKKPRTVVVCETFEKAFNVASPQVLEEILPS